MILDVLIKVGVTEKKTHSSSIEVDEAERSKSILRSMASPVQAAALARCSASDEFKPKIDLSHISKPGDVLKAITQRAAQPSAPARPAPPPPAASGASKRGPPSAVRPKPACSRLPPTASAPAAPAEPASLLRGSLRRSRWHVRRPPVLLFRRSPRSRSAVAQQRPVRRRGGGKAFEHPVRRQVPAVNRD